MGQMGEEDCMRALDFSYTHDVVLLVQTLVLYQGSGGSLYVGVRPVSVDDICVWLMRQSPEVDRPVQSLGATAVYRHTDWSGVCWVLYITS